MFSYSSLYKQLGNLWYAVAAADGQISKAEKKAIEALVCYSWKHLENSTDAFGTDAANIMLFQIDVNEEDHTLAEVAYQQFEEFFAANKRFINHYLRAKILNSARQVASSSRYTNHEEMKTLLRLKELLDTPVGAISSL
jgi:uncharacterized tellurite resistance protein B-like protein